MSERGSETPVEKQLKWLEKFGFEVVKLRTPGYNGVMDRMILWPEWSPKPPTFVECKAPKKHERLLQATLRDSWRRRGVDVRAMVDTVERSRYLCYVLLVEAVDNSRWQDLPQHIRDGYKEAHHYVNTPVMVA